MSSGFVRRCFGVGCLALGAMSGTCGLLDRLAVFLFVFNSLARLEVTVLLNVFYVHGVVVVGDRGAIGGSGRLFGLDRGGLACCIMHCPFGEGLRGRCMVDRLRTILVWRAMLS